MTRSRPRPTSTHRVPQRAKASGKKGTRFMELCEIMQRLLSPRGCPWDREQTIDSLKPYLIEEAYEVLDAMEGDDPAEHCEELGDLLFQVVFQSALREREGRFDVDDVSAAIAGKLIRRHPHVFADVKVSGSAEVLVNWEKIKAAERAAKGKKRTLAGVPRALPALLRATRISEKARRVGFDWPDASGARDKVTEELAELERARRAGRKREMQSELGDLLFAIVNYARKLEIDPELALRGATDRFEARFEHIEDRLAERGKRPADSTLEEMDALWNEAKRKLRKRPLAKRARGKQAPKK